MRSYYIKRIKLEFNDDVAIIDVEDITKKEIEKIKSKYENHHVSVDIKKVIVDNSYLILPFFVNELRPVVVH